MESSYSTYVIGFGIGWCLSYIIVLIFLSKKKFQKKELDKSNLNIDSIKDLVRKLNDIKGQFDNVRFDELKNRENAYSRNPRGFNYDYQGWFKEYDERVKSLDTDLSKCLKKCSEMIDDISRQSRIRTEEKQEEEKNPFAIVNAIGIIGILLANIIYFTKLL